MKVEISLNHIAEKQPKDGEEDIIVFSAQLDEVGIVTYMMWNEGTEDEIIQWKQSDDISWDLRHTPYWCYISDIKQVFSPQPAA